MIQYAFWIFSIIYLFYLLNSAWSKDFVESTKDTNKTNYCSAISNSNEAKT